VLLSSITPLTHSGCWAATVVARKPPREFPEIYTGRPITSLMNEMICSLHMSMENTKLSSCFGSLSGQLLPCPR